MARTKAIGDMAELAIAADLSARGYRILFPYGEDCDYDLAIERGEKLERVQVKYVFSDGKIVMAKCYSHSLTNGSVRRTKRYTEAMIDWLAVFDGNTRRCFYIPASELGDGRSTVTLRLTATANNQLKKIRMAENYEDLPPRVMQLGDPN